VNYNVCIQGFSSFERTTFESFFRLAARRAPSYHCVDDLAQADIVIADADRSASMDAVVLAGKLSRTLTVGARPAPGSAAGISRPINMMALLRMLDEITGGGTLSPVPSVAALSAPPSSARKVAVDGARAPIPPAITKPASEAPVLTSIALMTAPSREAMSPMPAEGNDPRAAHILVVDDSDIALRFMQMRLHRLRFQVSLASSGDEALRMLEMRRYAFVFLDVMMEGLDGFQTCKRIKRKDYADGAAPPRVIMLTSKGGPIDKLRGTIAGCDGYLVKPLNELELVKVIMEFDPGLMGRVEGSVAA
jgi:CheY-like chemotaxis protein